MIRVLARYLCGLTFTDDDTFGLRLPEKEMPMGFHLVYMQLSKRNVYTSKPGFSVILSKEKSWKDGTFRESVETSFFPVTNDFHNFRLTFLTHSWNILITLKQQLNELFNESGYPSESKKLRRNFEVAKPCSFTFKYGQFYNWALYICAADFTFKPCNAFMLYQWILFFCETSALFSYKFTQLCRM